MSSEIPTHDGRAPDGHYAAGARSWTGERPQAFPLDEFDGARAAGALLVGEREAAVDALERVSTRYLAGFLWRLGLVMPSVSVRLAWRLARRRLTGGSR